VGGPDEKIDRGGGSKKVDGGTASPVLWSDAMCPAETVLLCGLVRCVAVLVRGRAGGDPRGVLGEVRIWGV